MLFHNFQNYQYFYKKIFIIIVTISLFLWQHAAATTTNFSSIPLIIPNQNQALLDQTIVQILVQHHYKHNKLDNNFSSIILDSYLNALDVNRIYFLDSDILRFEKYRDLLDDALRYGDLKPAYDIYNIYLRRLLERTNYLQSLLKKEFQFQINEDFINPGHQKHLTGKSNTELDEFWRKKIKNEVLTLILSGKDQVHAKALLSKRYENRLRQILRSSSDNVFQIYMNAVANAFDPHTAYFSPRNTENFNIQMRLALEGIGCVLRLNEEEQVTVVELVAGGPAALSKKIEAGDIITAIAQGNEPWVDIVGWQIEDIVELIRGQRGTSVRLKIIPSNTRISAEEKVVSLIRDTIQLEKQAASCIIKTVHVSNDQTFKIGIITVPAFYSDFDAAKKGNSNYRSTTRDVKRLLEDMHGKIDGLLLDLRENGGGSLQEAVDLTGLFIDTGPVVQVKHADSEEPEIEQDIDQTVIFNGPLAVLVDRASASASEIFAGAIQDYSRGIIIGTPTFGKGTVQTLIDLNQITHAREPQGQIKLTVAKFYRISGSSTQQRGVDPDILIPSSFDSNDIGESVQQNALPWDEIKPTNYHKYHNKIPQLFPELIKLHKLRTEQDQSYQVFLKNLELMKQQRKVKVSLLEPYRRSEKEQLEQWKREMNNVLRSARGLQPLRVLDQIPEENNSSLPDIILEESIKILGDLINLSINQKKI